MSLEQAHGSRNLPPGERGVYLDAMLERWSAMAMMGFCGNGNKRGDQSNQGDRSKRDGLAFMKFRED